jgi:hypothetical protein
MLKERYVAYYLALGNATSYHIGMLYSEIVSNIMRQNGLDVQFGWRNEAFQWGAIGIGGLKLSNSVIAFFV